MTLLLMTGTLNTEILTYKNSIGFIILPGMINKLKNILFAATALLITTGCSSDTLLEQKDTARDAIVFTAATGKVSRSADYYCNATKPEQFNVWARFNGETYFENALYILKGEEWELQREIPYYWPEEGIVDFFAVKNHNSFEWKGNEAPVVPDFTVAADAKDQVDLIYAHTKAQKPETGCKAALNFRHALSQVVFKAQNLNKNIYVVINKVEVCNMPVSGSFTLPSEEVTDDNYSNPDGCTQATPAQRKGLGTWTLGNTLGNFSVSFDAVGVAKDSNARVNLTSNTSTVRDDADGKIGYGKSLLLLPTNGETTPYDPKQGGVSASGTYFLVYATIYNLSAGDGGVPAENDVCLWGTRTSTKAFAVPVAADWVQGKKYTYTFRFTEKGTGGFDPGSGDDVLVPIEFTVTVDDFTDASQYDLKEFANVGTQIFASGKGQTMLNVGTQFIASAGNKPEIDNDNIF